MRPAARFTAVQKAGAAIPALSYALEAHGARCVVFGSVMASIERDLNVIKAARRQAGWEAAATAEMVERAVQISDKLRAAAGSPAGEVTAAAWASEGAAITAAQANIAAERADQQALDVRQTLHSVMQQQQLLQQLAENMAKMEEW